MPSKIETLVTGVAFPECLRWHSGELWFSDVLGGKVFRFNLQTSQISLVTEISPMAGGLGWLPNGDLLAVDVEGRKVLQIERLGEKSDYLDLSEHWKYPANDMLIESNGTIWVGGYGYDPEIDSPQGSSLARYRDGLLDFPVGGLVFPNGIAQLDSKHLVVAETFADRLAIIEIHSTGQVSIEKKIRLPEGATPDGLCVDGNGEIWVASAYGEAVLKVDPRSERIERAIEIPGRGVFDCTFGGPDMQTLFIATSDLEESRALLDLPGQILAVTV